jgi:hypothetical protein
MEETQVLNTEQVPTDGNDPKVAAERVKQLHDALVADEVMKDYVPNDFRRFVEVYKDPKNMNSLYDALSADDVFKDYIPNSKERMYDLYVLGKQKSEPAKEPLQSSVSPSPSNGGVEFGLNQTINAQANQPNVMAEPQPLSPQFEQVTPDTPIAGVEEIRFAPEQEIEYQNPASQFAPQVEPTTAQAPFVPSKEIEFAPEKEIEYKSPESQLDEAIKKTSAEMQKSALENKGSAGGALYNKFVAGYTSVVEDMSRTAGELLIYMMPDLVSPGSTPEDINNSFEQLNIKKTLDKQLKSEGTTEEYIKKQQEEGNIIIQGALGLAESIYPMMYPKQAGFFFLGFNDARKEIEEAMPELSKDKQLVYAFTQGSVAIVLEKIGFSNLIKNRSVTKAITGKVLEKIKNVTGVLTPGKVEKIALDVANGFVSEFESGGTEFLVQEGIKQTTDYLTGEKDSFKFEGWDKFLNDALKAANTEGVGGLIMKTASLAPNIMLNPKNKAEAQEANARNETLKQDLQNPNIPDDVRQAIQKQADENSKNVFQKAFDDNEQVAALPTEAKTEVEKLNNTINQNNVILQNENVSAETKALVTKANEELAAQIEKVFKDNPPTQTTTEAAQAPQATEQTIPVADIETKRKETETKIKRKDLFRDGGVFANQLGESGVDSVPTNHSEINGIEFVEFSNPNTGVVDVIMTGKSDTDFVGYYRIYENGKPTNKWSSKFENQSRNKEDFKTMISGVQEMLPKGHEYTEKTSISTDGLRVWNQQLSKGYELQYDDKGNLITNKVAINGDAINNELGIPVNKGSFDNVSVTNSADMKKVKEALLPYLKKFGLNESNIYFENGTVKIDLPVLKNNKKGDQKNVNAKVEEVSKKLDALTEKYVKNGKTQKEAEDLALQSISEEERQVLRESYNESLNKKAPQQTKTTENAVQEPSTTQEIPRPGEAGQNIPEGGQGVRPGEQGKETAQQGEEEVKADIEKRRQEELKQRVVYDRFPTVADGEFKIIGDPNNTIYRINETTGRPQNLDETNGLWSNTSMPPKMFNENAKRQGFEKSKSNINAKYDAELNNLKTKQETAKQGKEEVKAEIADIERRREEEFNQYANDIIVKTELYEDGEGRKYLVHTLKNGKKRLDTANEEGKRTSTIDVYESSVPVENYIFDAKKITDIEKQPSNQENRINAKYDAELNNLKNKQDEKQNETNGKVVLEGVREKGNENEGGQGSEQLRTEIESKEKQVADLRAKEQAEYDAMSDPNDKAKEAEIYERYNKEITPLLNTINDLKAEGKGGTAKEQPTAGVPFIKKIFDKIRSATKLNKVQHNILLNIDTKLSKEIADAYEKMKHDPNNEKVKKAYQAMVDETKLQYDALIAGGLKAERWTGEGEPYANSKEMLNDLKENNHLYFLPNEAAFGDKDGSVKYKDNIGLQDSGVLLDGKPLTNSEVFRIVHDAVHGINGNEFGPIGEENATLQHLSMYSDEALPAVVAQTRGQNSWVNFSGVNDSANAKFKQAAKLEKEGKKDEAEKIRKEAQKEYTFADPKIGILPDKYNFRYYGTTNSELASKTRANTGSEQGNTGESKSSSARGYEKDVARESQTFSSTSNSEGRRIRTRYGYVVPKAIHKIKQPLVDAIKKVFPNGTVDKELFEVDADIFHKAAAKAKSVNKYGAAVDVLTPEQYSKYRLFITEDGLTGLALSPDGDMGTGFDMSGKPRRLAQLLILGIENGATHANAYDTILPNYYANFGFKPVARNLWNDNFKPDDWKYETFEQWNNGRPDVVHFIWDGGDRNTMHERIGQFDTYSEYHKERTPIIDTWDRAEEMVSEALSAKGEPTLTEAPTLEQQVSDFGVRDNMVKPVTSMITAMFDSAKKAGITAAKNLGEWIGIGKGSKEKSAALKKREDSFFTELGISKEQYNDALSVLLKNIDSSDNFGDAIDKTIDSIKEGDKINKELFTRSAIADITEGLVVKGEQQPTMVIQSAKEGKSYSGSTSIESLRDIKPVMYVNRAIELSASSLVKKGAVKKFSSDWPLDKKLKWAEDVYKNAKNTVVSNLLNLYDNIPENIRKVSKLWYDGANKIAQEFGKKYNITLEQSSAIIATLSPQKPWFDNLHIAHFIMDFDKNNQSTVLTQDVYNFYKRTGEEYPEQVAHLPSLKEQIGKKYSELSDYDKSVMIRHSFDTKYERRSPLRLPTGHIIGRDTPKASFSGYDKMANAVSILRDGSSENISNNIGADSKVRNFYNNIVDPTSDKHITIDTHAMAAGYHLPLGSKSAEVKFDLATYSFFHDAYTEAAKQRGVLPREMQSITWEGVKSLFPPNEKTEYHKKRARDLQEQFRNGTLTLEEVQKKIKENGKDLSQTDWSGHIDTDLTEGKTGGYINELSLVGRDKTSIGEGNSGRPGGEISGMESTNTKTDDVKGLKTTLKNKKQDENALKKGSNAQYRIENGKNIVEALRNFDGSPEAVVAITHEVMHPTVVSIIDGAVGGNEVGTKHTKTIVDEFNKANPDSKITVDELIAGNEAFKAGNTSDQYRAVQEFIAESWEKYHLEGAKGFSESFQKMLDQITEAFKAVYGALTGSQITPELRQMFDEILGKEAAVKKETPTAQTFADISQTGKAGRDARESARKKFGKDAVAKMEEISRNFDKLIEQLESENKVRKECP